MHLTRSKTGEKFQVEKVTWHDLEQNTIPSQNREGSLVLMASEPNPILLPGDYRLDSGGTVISIFIRACSTTNEFRV